MATIRKRAGGGWQAEVYRNKKREAKTFDTKAQALAWSVKREAELEGKQLETHTLGEALEKYAREIAPKHDGERWEVVRCAKLKRESFAEVNLAALTAEDIEVWRDKALEKLKPGSVAREMTLLRSVLGTAVVWKWLRVNPMADVKHPKEPAGRRRRITGDEIDTMTLALGYVDGAPTNLSQRVALAFLFALETAMRSGEITGLTWANTHPKSVTLPKTKNGDQREVPLSLRAREIIKLLPKAGSLVFGLDAEQRDALWRKARGRTGIENLRFHDSRAEAIWRLSKKLDVLELARVIGHRDINSLLHYYNATADELADKLG